MERFRYSRSGAIKIKKNYNKMLQAISVIVLILSVITPVVSSFEENGSVLNLTIDVKNINEETLELTISFPEFKFNTVNIENEKYASLCLQNEAYSLEIGQAKLPVIRRMIEIPYNSKPEILLTAVDWDLVSLDEMNLPDTILPVQPSILKIPEAFAEFVFDDEYYSTNDFMPIETVNILETGCIRERTFILIEINPVKYNPSSGEIKTMNHCNVIINMPDGDMEKTNDNINRYSSSSFEELLNSLFLNYGYYGSNILKDTLRTEGYLIIVHDDFYDEIMPLANWKTTMGYDTTVTLTSNIPGGVTADNIKAYIQDAYDTWTVPPVYILLVGDTPQIPAHTGTASGGETDSYFVRMDGDIFADIFIGRFPADSETQVDVMVDKTIYYEQGDFPSVDWIKKGAFIASDDASLTAEYTHNYVIETHLEPNGYTCDKIYERLGGSTSDITNALNEGRSLCIYSGHGGSSGWGCVPFHQSDVNALTNEGMYPFVCSHACSTSTYEGSSECFSETWVRAPNKGGIAMWGSSISTLWPEDDAIERRVFDAWWNLSLDRIGQMTDQGMYDAYQTYGPSIEKFIESYNVMGDASVKIWSDDPFTPEHDIELQNLDIADVVAHGETQTVSATVRNVGNNTETDIVVDFKVNGSVLGTETIPSLNEMDSAVVSFNWDPAIGTYLVAIESRPIPAEYDLLNNNVNKTVHVIPAPAINVSPSSFSFMVPTDATDTDTLVIENLISAEAALEFNISFSGDLGGSWLSANPSSDTVGIGSSKNVIITVNTTDLLEGDYQGNIIVESNDVNDPEVIVPVDLTVVYGNDMAALHVNSPVGTVPYGAYTINATVQNMGYYDQTNVLVNCSVFEGFLDYDEDFESGNGEYVSGGTSLWEWGTPTSGPSSAHSGSNCWGTNLDGNYVSSASATLDSTSILLHNGVSAELSFWHWYDTEDGSSHYDGGNVKISTDGGTYWEVLGEYLDPYPIEHASSSNDGIPHEPAFMGDSSGWQQVSFNLTEFAGETVRFRWHFGSDGSIVEPGWYIDDVEVSSNLRDIGDIVYTAEITVDIDAYSTKYVEFSPPWDANVNNNFSIVVTTFLPGDQNNGNNGTMEIVTIFQDTDPPEVTNIHDFPDPQAIDGFVNITCDVSDFTGVSSVFVDITGPVGFIPINTSMTQGTGDNYYHYTNYSVEGNYTYHIWAIDSLGNGITTSDYQFRIISGDVVVVEIPMEIGWNLITLPVDNDMVMASDLAENITGCLSVNKWDAVNQTYKPYIVGGPPDFDFPIHPGLGLFVDVDTASTLVLSGSPALGVSIDLKIGWNLIGWYHQSSTMASSLAENITGCLSVNKWDAVNQTYKPYIVGGPPDFDFPIHPGLGLFVDVDEESTWNGEG